MAVAAATPWSFMLNSPGADGSMSTGIEIRAMPPAIVTVAAPGAVSAGTWKLICVGDTRSKPAGRVTDAESETCMVMPSSVVGQGWSVACAITGAKFVPETVASDSGAKPANALAADVMAMFWASASEQK